MLKLDNVEKSYAVGEGKQFVLRSLSLALGSGESLAVMGPSGSGKSTLLAIVAGIVTADSGRVVVAGNELSQMDEDARAAFRLKNIGFVFQEHRLLPQLTALENVMLPTLALPHPDAAARANELLSQFGIAAMSAKFPADLSGGERQRVAIARALFHSPPILLADEPTGALDKENALRFLDLLAPLSATGTTILLATHSDIAAQKMQKIKIIEEGKIIDRSSK